MPTCIHFIFLFLFWFSDSSSFSGPLTLTSYVALSHSSGKLFHPVDLSPAKARHQALGYARAKRATTQVETKLFTRQGRGAVSELRAALWLRGQRVGPAREAGLERGRGGRESGIQGTRQGNDFDFNLKSSGSELISLSLKLLQKIGFRTIGLVVSLLYLLSSSLRAKTRIFLRIFVSNMVGA